MIHVCIFKGEKYSILISEFRLNFRKQIVFKAVLFKITVGNSNNDVTFYMLAYILDYWVGRTKYTYTDSIFASMEWLK